MNKTNTGEIEPGLYSDVSMPAYHEIHAVSSSGLSKLKQSPAHLKSYIDDEYEETHALKLGRMVHICVLEPEIWDEKIVCLGDCEATKKGDGEPCTNSAKGVWDETELCGTHSRGLGEPDEDIKTVKQKDYEAAMAIRETILNSMRTRDLVRTDGESEYTMIWEDPDTGLKCKARMDRYSPNVPSGAIVDLKTTRSADPDYFSKKIFDYGYYLQAAHYLKGAQALDLDIKHFVIIACEKKPPYAVRPYRMRDALSDPVEDELFDLYHLWKRCIETDSWPGYPDRLVDISVPGWAEDKMDTERQQIELQLQRLKNE